jgi:RimJ/RimL family protein N-acetyltransferase
MWSRPDERPVRTALPGGAARRTGAAEERDAAWWLASQDRGWRDGDRLSFAVLEADDAGGCVLAGNVGLKNREETGRVGERETAEIGYWTAVAARGRGIAPAAVRAVTDWVFDAFARARLRQIMLVHDVGNPASCRVAEKARYPFRELSPANRPHWLTDGHNLQHRDDTRHHCCHRVHRRLQPVRVYRPDRRQGRRDCLRHLRRSGLQYRQQRRHPKHQGGEHLLSWRRHFRD